MTHSSPNGLYSVRALAASLFAGLLAWLILAGLCPVAAAAPPQYRFDNWNTDNGLPQNSVNAILQTRDGYLWLTTSDGLVRYDGVRFAVFNKGNTPGIKSNRCTALFEAQDGDLWIGTEDSGLMRYHAGAFTTYTTADGLRDNLVRSIRADAEGQLLVLNDAGLVAWRGDKFTPYAAPDASAQPPLWRWRFNSLSYFDQTGVHAFAAGRFRTYTTSDGLPNLDLAWLYEDQTGTLWAATNDATLFRLRGGVWAAISPPAQSPPMTKLGVAYEDRAGDVWFSTTAGLCRWHAGELTTYGAAQGLADARLSTIYQDREGTLWVGTTGAGLYRLTRQPITVYAERDGLTFPNAYTVYEDHAGDIWIGTWGGGVFRLHGGAFTNYTARDGLFGTLATALYEDAQGRLWVGTKGVNLFTGERFTGYTARDGLSRGNVLAITQTRDGALWFGTETGLSRFDGSGFTNYTTRDGLAHDRVQALLEDHAGALWLGTAGGLSCLKDGRFTNYTERDGLASNYVRALYEDAAGTLWIGTYDGGLSRFRSGRFTSYTTRDGLYSNGVFQILADDRGNLWMSCNLGIYRVRKVDLEDFAAGRTKSIACAAYGKKDGLLSIECNGGKQPAGWRTRDGRLWFPTQQGVAVIDPATIESNPLAPPVVVEDFILNNKSVPFRDTVEIPPGQEGCEIRYAGLSFTAPEQVHFKFRLIGLDADWVDAGTRRVAYYRYLPPGTYTFQVIAANSDGVWNTEGAAIRLVVRPPFWRTWWFIALCAAGCAGVAYVVYRRRIAQLERARTAQEAFSRRLIESQEHERKRIAAELHDSLGQNLLVIKNRALLSLSAPDDKQSAVEQLQEISTTASQAIDEVRAIAHDLRPYQLDRLGLTKALDALVRKVAAASGLACTAEIDPLDGLFTKEAEINLYRIVQESLNNIVKHAHASAASVVVRCEARAVLVRISDDGRGFAPDSEGERRGFGLSGIAERARILGGQPVIESAPGRGTTLTLRLNLPPNQNGH
ncbi:MAG: two-component regulator propeller domain-containing protein [Pyrinomonadaceae bacterium]